MRFPWSRKLKLGQKCVWKSKDYDFACIYIKDVGEKDGRIYSSVMVTSGSCSCVPKDELVKTR